MPDLLNSDIRMPANVAAERTVLGLAIDDPKHLYTLLEDQTGAELFSLDSHRKLYFAFALMAERNQPVDLRTVLSELIKHSTLDAVGAGYLADLTTGILKTQNIEAYLTELRELTEKRAFIRLCHRGMSNALESSVSFREAATQYEEDFHQIAGADHGRKVLRTADTIDKSMDEVFNPNHPNRETITTGNEQLDNATCGGMRKSEYWIYAAMTGRGKTASARQAVAANVLLNVPTLVFSIEMTRSQWEQQTVATHARITTGRMRNPEFLNVVERQKLRDAVEEFRNRPLFIDDSSPLHIRELLARARQFIRKEKVRLVVVDYLQTIDAPGREKMERVSNASAALRDLAKSENVTVLALSQLRRPASINDRPTMIQLKESGDIEQHAHTIVLNYLPRDEGGNFTGDDELIIDKQRFGRQGPLLVSFNTDFLIFEPRWMEGK
jgi:replicative DNA helicase